MLLLHLLAMCSDIPAVSENVVVVVADGLRREEVFGGAQADLLNGVGHAYQQQYGGAGADERRRALMPFLWSTVMDEGQLLGDPDKGSSCEVTNPHLFSYPGYSEMLCGFVDPRISKNDPIPNPNPTVFEWLNGKPEFKGHVAAFGAWDVISSVFNKQRCNFDDVAGYEPVPGRQLSAPLRRLNTAKRFAPRVWKNEAPDALTFDTALEYVKSKRPRALFISLGETDKWAHEGRYDRYLDAAHAFDADVAQLWRTLQAIPQYQDKTTLIVTCDHGRGAGLDWRSHGRKLPNSKFTWMAFVGPGTSPGGDVAGVHATNAQIASTAAAALGFNYAWSVPKAAPPLLSAIR
ncbi:MAG TPA: alkaline phosphatase family protein [Fimbriimonadaceae bacterium]|nr:alkaline phosphatase family protein [Fimbriimonadaceae bacterium]